MSSKRSWPSDEQDADSGGGLNPRGISKRPRLYPPGPATSPSSSSSASRTSPAKDRISPLSDELLIRILSHLSLVHLLGVAPVSRRFHRLSVDSQLWRQLYYDRFVLPRAMRLPAMRLSQGEDETARLRRYSPRWTGLGSISDLSSWTTPGSRDGAGKRRPDRQRRRRRSTEHAPWTENDGDVDWKQQYRLRHNWLRGRCVVEELSMSEPGNTSRRTLVKVADGVAITADAAAGLRLWCLRTRRLLAQADFDVAPSAIAVDEERAGSKILDICVGFADGSFGIWTAEADAKTLVARYRHEKSSNGTLIGVAFAYPHVITATAAALVSLYTFNRPGHRHPHHETPNGRGNNAPSQPASCGTILQEYLEPPEPLKDVKFPPPYLLTSLRSPTSQTPLTLSIRRTAQSVIASIAYTVSTRTGFAISIQDLIMRTNEEAADECETLSTRIAYTESFMCANRARSGISNPAEATPHRSEPAEEQQDPAVSPQGPTSLCYSHPYLLTTLPDNTLILHLCTSSATSLSFSRGIRLWGHTSGIGDAEITPRGKAVSVSQRGDELRVWELEGRINRAGANARSVQIRPREASSDGEEGRRGIQDAMSAALTAAAFEGQRNWVGFDDEMVTVLKEAGDGRESLMVYDFT